MNVRKLIEELETIPGSAEVELEDFSGYGEETVSVEAVMYLPDANVVILDAESI